MRAQLGAALMLLTRVPGSWLIGTRPFPAAGACVWAYPLVGAVVGGLAALILWTGRAAGLPPLVDAAWALIATILLTGGLHEDGLADMADGFGGGRSVERKLEIMRDSRVGSYGVLALVLSTMVRWSALASMTGVGGVIASAALSRAAMLGPMHMPPARRDGLGAGLGAVPLVSAVGCVAIGCLVAIVAVPGRAILVIALAAAASLGVRLVAQRQIGGFTGDVLGGCAVVVESVVLTALAW